MTRAAKGVLTIANLTMSSIIKKISIARGYDPRDFALFCYGGGGPLHGIELAAGAQHPARDRAAGAGQFLRHRACCWPTRGSTPRAPCGARSTRRPCRRCWRSTASSKHKDGEALRREFGEGEITVEREAEMRYKGQQHSLKIALPAGRRCRGAARAVRPRIPAALRPRQPGRRGRARGAAFARHPAHGAAGASSARRPRPAGDRRAELEVRPIFFLEEDRFLDATIFDRYALPVAFRRGGPGADRGIRVEHADRPARHLHRSASSRRSTLTAHA